MHPQYEARPDCNRTEVLSHHQYQTGPCERSYGSTADRAGVPRAWCARLVWWNAGIGRAHNIAMSTLPGFSLPGDVSASQRYWSEDIIEPPVEVTEKGTIRVPVTPGLGYAVKRDRIEKITARRNN